MKGRDVPLGVPICSHEKFLLGRNLNASWSELMMYVDDQYKWGDVSSICSFDASSSVKTLSFRYMVFSFREKFRPCGEEF